jgi:3-hydroxypropanoate dehydrogenase
LHELTKWGATSANCCPARFIFVKSPEAKAKLKPCLSAGNADKTMTAPVCAIIAYDLEFYEQLPRLFPHTDARSWFVGKEKAIQDTAFRNSSLQGAYLMLAARALGLDCGPMSGFNAEKLKAAFFSDKPWVANFICSIGYGDHAALFPRSPRFDFADVCSIV